MGKKITQKEISAAIKALNDKCPYCVKGKVNKGTCPHCKGSGKKN
jgi:rubrerythrin